MSETTQEPLEIIYPDGTVTDKLGNFQGIDQPAAAALYGALAKAQGEFPTIPRNRTVTVRLKDNKGTYTFNYAPLDTILDAVRPALTANGLAITQLLDASGGEQVLRTILLHADGGTLESVWPIRSGGTPQEFGSALTYLRRYTLVALLGVASEEDDDGNHASGNTAEEKKPPPRKTAAKPAPTPETPAAPAADGERSEQHEKDFKAVKAIQRVLMENGLTEDQFQTSLHSNYGTTHVSELTAEQTHDLALRLREAEKQLPVKS